MIQYFYSEISYVYMRRWGWYFQIVLNEHRHGPFPIHNYKRVVTLSAMILDNSQREMLSQYVFSCIIFCAIYATTYAIRIVFRSDIFSPEYMWNSKVKIWVSVRLVKRDDLSVSTSQWSSHVSQCLRNNWVNRWRYTLVYFTAQTPLRMHKTPPDVTLAGGWNNLKHHRDCCHYIGHSCIGLRY